MERGGILAVPNLRGGGEYGEQWHLAGTKERKQNVFDDFIAAGEWLISNQYTSRSKLAIMGGSNGGLLVAACMTQRPDLFGAVVPTVGVMDMLRFHKFTIGSAWTSDYGSPDDPEEFKYLFAYSPYHNIQTGTTYPPTLITTGDHDDRVVPSHSYKFAAALQAAQGGPAPILIRVEVRAGHGVGKPISMQIGEVVDVMSFLGEGAGRIGNDLGRMSDCPPDSGGELELVRTHRETLKHADAAEKHVEKVQPQSKDCEPRPQFNCDQGCLAARIENLHTFRTKFLRFPC